MKRIIALIFSITLIFTLAACGSPATTPSTNSRSDESNLLIMATNAEFPPYEYYENEKIVGIDAEVAQAIADKLGMTLRIDNMAFGSIITAVTTGKASMGIAGMTITDERLQSVNFTNSYTTGIQVVIVKEGSAITAVSDITSSNKIGVQQDTTGDIYASDTPENGGYGENAVIRYNSGADAVQALMSGKVDCVIIDNEPAKAYLAANKGLKILDTEFAVENYAICLAKNNDELKNKINGALESLIADGTVSTIIKKYIPSN